MAEMNEILQRFVAHKSELRDWLHQPFKIGEWVYATDGHIIVRVPAAGQESLDGAPIPVDITGLFGSAHDAAQRARTIKVGLPALPEAQPCFACGGSASTYLRDDQQECFQCDGTGVERHQSVTVGARDYARRYLAKIADLPGLAFHQTPNEDIDPAFFTFDGGEGLLMPLRKRRTTKR